MFCIRHWLQNGTFGRPIVPISTRLLSTPAGENVTKEDEVDKLYRIVELQIRGNNPAVLKSYRHFATLTGNNFNLETTSWTMFKPIHERYTLLKSVHVHKKHRVQYEARTYYAFIQYKRVTGSTADTLLEYLERNLPEGVALKATKVELQKIPSHFTPGDNMSSKHVEVS